MEYARKHCIVLKVIQKQLFGMHKICVKKKKKKYFSFTEKKPDTVIA